MTVKLLMTWDIQSGKEQEYFEFVAGEFIPGLQRLGLETSDAWFTVYGNQPQIMAGAKSTDYDEMEDILDSDGWDSLIIRLHDYVENYRQKIVADRPGFQL